MTVVALLIVVVPFAAGGLVSAFVGGQGWHRIGAFVLGVAITICVVWLLLRADERPWEGVLALAFILGDVLAIKALRAHQETRLRT